MERGDANLRRETERTKRVTADSSTCWLYTVICVLLLVLIVLVAMRWA